MTAINVSVDNEYFMVKVQRCGNEVEIEILTPDQSKVLDREWLTFNFGYKAQQFELDFDKRDAKKVVRRYLKFR